MTVPMTYRFPVPLRARGPQPWPESRFATAREEPAPYNQGALALTFPLPSGVDCVPRSTALTLVQPGPPRTGEVEACEAWVARYLQAVVEVLSGDRPLTQLIRWTDSAVYTEIARRRELLASRQARSSRSGRPHVATVHICHPTADTAEVAARVTTGMRSRAIAARLDLRRDRWLCTALQLG
jgi:Family of unknown function (DUF6459)